MSNPTGDALLARIRMLEDGLKEIQVYVVMNGSHVNPNQLLRLLDEALKGQYNEHHS